jgi:hypothetical protein
MKKITTIAIALMMLTGCKEHRLINGECYEVKSVCVESYPQVSTTYYSDGNGNTYPMTTVSDVCVRSQEILTETDIKQCKQLEK